MGGYVSRDIAGKQPPGKNAQLTHIRINLEQTLANTGGSVAELLFCDKSDNLADLHAAVVSRWFPKMFEVGLHCSCAVVDFRDDEVE